MAKGKGKGDEKGENKGEDNGKDKGKDNQGKKRRRWLPYLVFGLTLLLGLIFHECQQEPLPPASIAPKPSLGGPAKPAEPEPAAPETLAPPPKPIPRPNVVPKPKDTLAAPRVLAPVDSGPYLWADPWGGRHFDSVRVTLHCREGCLLLYSLEDSVHFNSYESPLVFKRNATLWISGIDSLNRQAPPVRVDYVIERNPGACKGNAMPIAYGTSNGGLTGAKTVCMDMYEWPNSEDSVPRAFVNWKEAVDSCKSVGKRLCTEPEWREGCEGPDREKYPYGGKYNENRCPAKETAASRSGRFPVCRSYYGLYDMTGNLWEWTATPAPDADFQMVAGGNWAAGNEATCNYAKFSFYPSVRYPFVGFRCCEDAGR
ncbi:MAG: SUMF1/EgtB/PvdO family nonheme iron enzyme [Fibrobacteria bacterium]